MVIEHIFLRRASDSIFKSWLFYNSSTYSVGNGTWSSWTACWRTFLWWLVTYLHSPAADVLYRLVLELYLFFWACLCCCPNILVLVCFLFSDTWTRCMIMVDLFIKRGESLFCGIVNTLSNSYYLSLILMYLDKVIDNMDRRKYISTRLSTQLATTARHHVTWFNIIDRILVTIRSYFGRLKAGAKISIMYK
jgi:hypothetical protein